jgi:hypothetical protein
LAKERTKSPQCAENKRLNLRRSLAGFAESEHGAENKANVVAGKLDIALEVFAVRRGYTPGGFLSISKEKSC